ncbi:MAG: hypothetical protein RLZZ628_2724, partial [Bacteroidota bacterium]
MGTRRTRIGRIFADFSFLSYTLGYILIRMDVRIPQISRIGTDFLKPMLCFKQKNKKNPYQSVKSVESVH